MMCKGQALHPANQKDNGECKKNGRQAAASEKNFCPYATLHFFVKIGTLFTQNSYPDIKGIFLFYQRLPDAGSEGHENIERNFNDPYGK